jgi:hypothetical protein
LQNESEEGEIPIEARIQPVKIGKLSSLLRSTKPETHKETAAELQEPEVHLSPASLKKLTEYELRKILKDFSLKLIKENRMSLGAYLNDPILRMEKNELRFTVPSKSLKIDIEDVQRKMQGIFIDQGFQTPIVTIDIDVAKVQELKPSSGRDLFNKVAKEHPILKDFADKFGLDFDA